MILKTLYKLDSKGKVRVWSIEVEGDKYRVISGLQDGKKTESTWRTANPKNVGRSNETTGAEQAILEAESKITSQIDSGYAETIEDSGAKFFEPMLAIKFKDVKKWDEDLYFVQPKLDGVRAVVKSDGVWARSGKENPAVPHILEEYKFLETDIILDGELYNHRFRDNFNEIQSLALQKKPTEEDHRKSARLVEYHVYDCFIPSEPDASFNRRIEVLNDLLDKLPADTMIKLVETTAVSGHGQNFNPIYGFDTLYSEQLEDGYEGQMIRLNRTYENKRSKSLIKRKEFEDSEYRIVRLEEGKGNWSGCVKRVICARDDGVEFGSGLRGSQEYLAQMLLEADEYVNGTVTVRYPNLTPDGIPRFPVAVALYKGKRDS